MIQDLIGKRFGMLVVESETDPVRDARGHLIRMFNCRCDCGKEKEFRYNSLLSGITRSCGCTRFPKQPPMDLTGRRFGILTVVSEADRLAGKDGYGLRRWNCICDCGNTTVVLQSNLTSRRATRSCGCLHRQKWNHHRSAPDLIGNRYGWLTVAAAADPVIQKKGGKKRRWICRCKCGRETTVEEWNLLSGHSGSCGCMSSKGLKGMKFGLLTVVSKAQSNSSKRYWTCRCDCGNETVVSRDDLMWGTIRDCGCVRYNAQRSDLTGQQFGKLTVLREVSPAISPKGEPVRCWLCRCTCGREVVVRQKNLTGKVTRSCGCIRKKKRTQ